MDIYSELKADHKKIKSLLKKLEDTTEKSVKQRKTLLKQLKETLVPHARAEEKALYERLKESTVKEAGALAFEGYEEHGVADRLMELLEDTSPNDKKWTALIAVIKESLEHHIEEEEGDIFKKARKSFDRKTAVTMGEEFLRLKAQFLAEVKQGKTPAQPESHELVAA
jgi:hemerythrin superfamily protein